MSPVAIMLSQGLIDNDLFLGLSGSSTFLEALTVDGHCFYFVCIASRLTRVLALNGVQADWVICFVDPSEAGPVKKPSHPCAD